MSTQTIIRAVNYYRSTVNDLFKQYEPVELIAGSILVTFILWITIKILSSWKEFSQSATKTFFKVIKKVPGAEAIIQKKKMKLLKNSRKNYSQRVEFMRFPIKEQILILY